jgi:hypothetical protein
LLLPENHWRFVVDRNAAYHLVHNGGKILIIILAKSKKESKQSEIGPRIWFSQLFK